MSSPLCVNCSRDSSRAGLVIVPVGKVGTEKQGGTGLEVMCPQFEVISPVVEVDSAPVTIGPVVDERGPVVPLTLVKETEVLSLVVQAVIVKVSAVEALGPACELGGPWLKTGSVDEVRCFAVESVFFAPVMHIGPGGPLGLVTEVVVSVVECTGPVVKATDPVVDM